MPDVYPSHTNIPKLGGVVKNGVTMMMHKPDDIRYAQAVCRAASQSQAPLYALYGLLHSDPLPEELLEPDILPWSETDEKNLSHDAHALDAVLSLAHHIWTTQDDPDELVLALSVARPDSPAGPQLEAEIQMPSLVFHRGSVIVTLATGAFKAASFAAMFLRARGIGASQRAEHIIEDTRKRALASPGVEPLERLDMLPRLALQARKGVVILLHGLLSTDVGIFDGLIRLLQDDDRFSKDYAIVGWPHDTFVDVDTNALQLLRLVEKVIGVGGPAVVFVCHSRGGLLARCAAVKLYEKDKIWQDKIKGCVTFGTPHEGSPLAEGPPEFVGGFVAIQAASNTKSFFSLADTLVYARQRQGFPGIENLRPMGGGGQFIKELVERELHYAPQGKECLLDVFAVGGETRESNFLAGLARRALGGSDNDLVVKMSSSVPDFFTHRHFTDCNHFGYFRQTETSKQHMEQAVKFVGQKLGWRQASDGDTPKFGAVPLSRET